MKFVEYLEIIAIEIIDEEPRLVISLCKYILRSYRGTRCFYTPMYIFSYFPKLTINCAVRVQELHQWVEAFLYHPKEHLIFILCNHSTACNALCHGLFQ